MREFLRERKLDDIFSVTVSEIAAPAFTPPRMSRGRSFPISTSPCAAPSRIARRLQDPLSELVKVDPKSIGVGQYQHDVDQRQLQQSLETRD